MKMIKIHKCYKLNQSGQKLDNLEFHNTIIEISRIKIILYFLSELSVWYNDNNFIIHKVFQLQLITSSIIIMSCMNIFI